MVSLMKTPGFGGTQVLGTATNRTSTSAPRFAPDQMTQDTCGKKFPLTSLYELTGLLLQA